MRTRKEVLRKVRRFVVYLGESMATKSCPSYFAHLSQYSYTSCKMSMAHAWFRRVIGCSSTDCVPPPIVQTETKPQFDPTALGLKEIGNLASWTVSSSKPGCGVEALRDDDNTLFWQ